mmetsp:Transcript_35966/g.94459  ORF Transcript_35966/g.94459 Transcript_35966/m.94459 type:complete len:87 (+) Transcript_35966:108-368(+)
MLVPFVRSSSSQSTLAACDADDIDLVTCGALDAIVGVEIESRKGYNRYIGSLIDQDNSMEPVHGCKLAAGSDDYLVTSAGLTKLAI